jgi:hypothetical protein
MDTRLLGRRTAAISGVAAFVVMGGLTAACAKEEKKAPEKAPETTTTTTTTATTSAPASAPAPTEKSINPTGGNLFTPPVVAPPAPTVPPGQHPGINGVP